VYLDPQDLKYDTFPACSKYQENFQQVNSTLINLLILSIYDYMVTPWPAQFLNYVVENKQIFWGEKF
jgi:hypothetical protein